MTVVDHGAPPTAGVTWGAFEQVRVRKYDAKRFALPDTERSTDRHVAVGA